MQIITDEFQKERKEHGNYYFPFLLSYERLSKYEAGEFLWHWHPEIELTFVLSGEMEYRVNNEAVHLCEGQALFANSGALHSGKMCRDRDCEYIALTFDTKLIYGYENSIIYTKYIKPFVENYGLSLVHFDLSQVWHADAIQVIKDMIEIAKEKGHIYELELLIKLDMFWKMLIENNRDLPIESTPDRRNYERLRDILLYIERHYDADITLDDIAKAAHLCKSECSRMFKKYMQISLFTFITQYRIEKSCYYLINTNLSVGEIADRVGFNDPDYFTKVFHRQKGCTPLKYRKNRLCLDSTMLIK